LDFGVFVENNSRSNADDTCSDDTRESGWVRWTTDGNVLLKNAARKVLFPHRCCCRGCLSCAAAEADRKSRRRALLAIILAA
jgi:hypothetical protein